MENKSFRRFLILWLGELVSSIGSGLTAFGLGVYVFEQTHSAAAVSLVTLCSFLPSILLAPVAGVLADRFDRRLLMLVGDGCSAFGLLYILLVLLNGEAALWQICVGVAFSSIFASLTDPAYKATITDMLTEEQFAKASGMVQLAGSSKYLISPVLAGFLIGVIGVKGILALDISTFFLTLLTITLVRRSMTVSSTVRRPVGLIRDLKEGWQSIAAMKGVLHLTLILTLATFCVGFLQILFTPMVLPLSNAKILGIVISVSATGLLAGSLFIGVFSMSRSYTRVLSYGLFVSGLFFSMVGVSTSIYMITAAAFLFFAALPFVNTSADVLIRRTIPNEAQGRAWGIIGVISQMGYIGAYALAGVLSDYVFNPLMREDGALASSIGKIIGAGPGRGIGLLLVLSGIGIMFLAAAVARMRSIHALEAPRE